MCHDGGLDSDHDGVAMRKLKIFAVAFPLVALPSLTTSFAKDYGRPQDGFYSGQSNSQYSGQSNGQVDLRVDGRGSRNEGLPPSAADRSNRTVDNPVAASDCTEVNSISPDARPDWQARVRSACQ
jgi:hypothetical protein